MEQQNSRFETLICSLNASELQSLILHLTESDTSLLDRVVGLIRHLFPFKEVPNASQWDPREALSEARRILQPRKKYRSDDFEMEKAGDLYNELLLSLKEMFQVSFEAQIVQILVGLTKLVTEDLDRIIGGCDEGLPWQQVAKQLGQYWLQLASSKNLLEADRIFLLSLLSECLPQLADYGLDNHFYPAITAFQKKV